MRKEEIKEQFRLINNKFDDLFEIIDDIVHDLNMIETKPKETRQYSVNKFTEDELAYLEEHIEMTPKDYHKGTGRGWELGILHVNCTIEGDVVGDIEGDVHGSIDGSILGKENK